MGHSKMGAMNMAQGIDPNGLDPVGEWMFGWIPEAVVIVIVVVAVFYIVAKLGD